MNSSCCLRRLDCDSTRLDSTRLDSTRETGSRNTCAGERSHPQFIFTGVKDERSTKCGYNRGCRHRPPAALSIDHFPPKLQSWLFDDSDDDDDDDDDDACNELPAPTLSYCVWRSKTCGFVKRSATIVVLFN